MASQKETNMKTITDYVLHNQATLIFVIPLLLVVTFFIGLAIVLLKWPRPRPVQVIYLCNCHVYQFLISYNVPHLDMYLSCI